MLEVEQGVSNKCDTKKSLILVCFSFFSCLLLLSVERAGFVGLPQFCLQVFFIYFFYVGILSSSFAQHGKNHVI